MAMVPDTPAGRAILDKAFKAEWNMPPSQWPWPMLRAWRQPHLIRYTGGKPWHIAPDVFLVTDVRGLTHCEWIIPGTLDPRVT